MREAGVATEWDGPGARGGRRRGFAWSGLLWTLVYPRRGQRTAPTAPGLATMALCLGIGVAAYNASSNILFITLALLLSCLILSAVLGWLNLRGVAWRLRLAPPLRAGHDAVAALELRNGKRFLPAYGLGFEFAAREAAEEGRAEGMIRASGAEVRAMIARGEAAVKRGRAWLGGRIEPRGEAVVEWVFRPERRGRARVELAAAGSAFPFGFSRREAKAETVVEAVVWPAPVAFRWHGAAGARRAAGGERVTRAGSGGDLLALRRYGEGDSHRLIHWKASARTGTLLVRQFAAETAEGYSMWLRTDAETWGREEQFELLVGFAASLAEDLYRSGRLVSVALDAEAPRPVRGAHDLEAWLDRLALARPMGGAGAGGALVAARRNVITFAPEGARGVVAQVGGERMASA